MIATAPVLLAGASGGAGLVMLAAGVWPGRSDLGDLAARVDAARHRPAAAVDGRAGAPGGPDVVERLGLPLLRVVGESLLPRRELRLLGRSAARHLGTKAALAMVALVLPAVATAGLGAVGMALPLGWEVPAGACLLAAAVFWFLPDVQVRQLAGEARAEFRASVATYLELVWLEREADAGPTEALMRAAEIGDSWVVRRIRDALVRAQLSGSAPWDALRELSAELEVPELGAPADIISLAGQEGAGVRSTLQAQARSLRSALLNEAHARANAASERMTIPVVLLVVLMTAYASFPAFTRILSA